MLRSMRINTVAAALLAVAIVGCEDLPGSKGQQGAVIGGVAGAATGAAVGGSEHRLLGTLLGAAIGAGGGYLIGANVDKITGKESHSAERAVQEAQTNPATPEQARRATTADLNTDGFVTIDEVIAMDQAGLSDSEILNRLRASGQVFELTAEQRQTLLDRGVSREVVDQLENINREQRDRLLSQTDDNAVISRPNEPAGTTRP